MGTTVQDTQDNEAIQEGSESADSTSTQETQPTPQPQSPATDDATKRYTELLERTLKEQNTQIQNLQDRALAPAPTQEPALSEDEERNLFYNKPKQMIKKELQETIAPILDFIKEFKGQNKYVALKSQFKADPRFAQMWDPQFEAVIDAALAKAEINENNVQAAFVYAAGLKAIGQLGSPIAQPAQPTNNQDNRQVPTPPHIRPSAPSSAPLSSKPKLRELTENEMRLARERGQTKEEYLAWLDIPPDEVVTSKIGRTA